VVSYSTRLGARHSTLPLLVPAAALQRAPDSRGALVDLNVTFAGDGGARVRLPRFEPTGRSGEWQTRLALPSMLRIDLPAASTDRCDAFQAGPTGGLVWRALTFVGTMGLWIPVYFWWFGRRQAGGVSQLVWFWTAVATYMAVACGIGLWHYRRASNEDGFHVAGRSLVRSSAVRR
jgi:hypothetical protein